MTLAMSMQRCACRDAAMVLVLVWCGGVVLVLFMMYGVCVMVAHWIGL